MVRAWIHSKQLAIEHVRNRRERMPVLGMNMSEGPLDPSPRQARAHVRVVEHVKRIVVINELVTACLSKYRPRKRDQKNTDANKRPARLVDAHRPQFNDDSRFFQMNLRFIGLAVLKKRLAEEIIGVGIFRVDLQRLFILKDRFPQPAAAMETDSKIIMRQRTGWLQLQDVAVIQDRFVNASLLQKEVGERGSHIRIRGANLFRRFVLCNRVLHSVLVQEKLAESQMGHVILSGHGQGVSPKPFAIVPVPTLVRRTKGERAYYDAGGGSEEWPMVAPGPGKIDKPPSGRDVEPDLRQISITIGMRLSADLH